jgi:putative transposase
VIYTTNVIESLNMQLRKTIKTRGHFPSDDAATKLLSLALRNIMDGKVRSTREWRMAMNQFAALYGDRFRPEESKLSSFKCSDPLNCCSGVILREK